MSKISKINYTFQIRKIRENKNVDFNVNNLN